MARTRLTVRGWAREISLAKESASDRKKIPPKFLPNASPFHNETPLPTARAGRMPARGRAYHDTGVSGALPKKHYVGPGGLGVGKRPEWVRGGGVGDRSPTTSDSDDESSQPSFVSAFFNFLEDEFWLFFFAVVYAFSVIAFLLALASKVYGSRRKLWGKIILAFIPWTIATTMWLIDPRWESWSVSSVRKVYFRYTELRHKPGELLDALGKWWRWRREYKPPRVWGV
jgi:hypothetical protein